MKTRLVVALAALLASTASFAAVERYDFDPNHSQIRFGYSHLGFSNLELSFQTFTGTLMLDTEDFTKSSVDVTIPIESIYTGVDKFTTHLKSPDFFNLEANPNAVATYRSRKVTKVDEDSLTVDGDLTLNGVTKPVSLDVTVNKIGAHPMTKNQAAGFDATATIKRSDFNLGYAVPNVGDEVKIEITTEVQKAKAADAATEDKAAK